MLPCESAATSNVASCILFCVTAESDETPSTYQSGRILATTLAAGLESMFTTLMMQAFSVSTVLAPARFLSEEQANSNTQDRDANNLFMLSSLFLLLFLCPKYRQPGTARR